MKYDFIELEPYGVTAGADDTRPVMLFKELEGEEMLPVWLSPIDAGIAVAQHSQPLAGGNSPHDLTLKVIETLGVKLDRCVFTEIRGHHQYLELFFTGSRKMKSIVARADQAISFCLHAKTRFYCTRNYIQNSKVVTAEMVGVMADQKKKNSETGRRPRYLN